MIRKHFIKSANEDQIDVDAQLVDEVSNAEEFADVEISHEDVMDALEAIDALADAVIEKANIEEKEIDADTLLDEVRDMIDDSHEEEVTLEEEEELPQELVNSAVRVMLSEDGAVEIEQKPDEVYDSDVDGLKCTMFDTCDVQDIPVEETAENTDDDDLLVIGNSATKNYKKGYVVLKSGTNKKAWSAAVKKVKKMIGNAKMTAAHWAIVSAIAKKEEEADKLKKKIECKLIKIIRSNKDIRAKLLKSEAEIDNAGQPIAETKPEQTAGEGNPGFEEKPNDGVPPEAGKPEGVTEPSGNPTEDPDKQVENQNESIVLPEGDQFDLEVALTNSKKTVKLEKISSNTVKGFNVYKVVNSSKELETLDGKCVRSGKLAYVFKNTGAGLLACAAKFVDAGKGTYKTVLKSDKVVITRGAEHPVFNNAEKVIIAKMVASARNEGRNKGRIQASKDAILATRQPQKPALINSALINAARHSQKPVLSAAERQARLEEIKARHDARRGITSSKENEDKLRKMYEQEERQRLFQSSQKELNAEKIAIKQSNTRNAETLNKLYDSMF